MRKLFLPLVLLLAHSNSLPAQDTSWENLGTGDWFDEDNWSDGVPTSETDVFIDNGGTSQVGVVGAETYNIRIGEMSVGLLEIAGGGTLYTPRSAILGDKTDSSGTVTVSGAESAWGIGNGLFVGNEGTGDLRIEDGGNVHGATTVGVLADSLGEITVTGSDSIWSSVSVTIAESGTANVRVEEGATFTSGQSIVGNNAGSTGSIAVVGEGSHWQSSGVNIGWGGRGVAAIQGGGSASSSAVLVGADESGQGELNVTGTDSKWIIRNDFTPGSSGSALVTISDGGELENHDAFVARLEGSSAIVTVTGSGSIWESRNRLTVAAQGTAEFTISDGGVASSRTSAGIATLEGSQGKVTVTGAGSRFEGSIRVGEEGVGELVIADGGFIEGSSGTIGHLSSARVSGENSSWELQAGSSASNMYVAGELVVEKEGFVSNSSHSVIDNFMSETPAKVIVTGPGSEWISGGYLTIGDYGSGELLIADGGVVTNARTFLGTNTSFIGEGGTGSLTVTGTGSQLVAGFINVGNDGAGEILISDGGVVSSVSSNIGRFEGSSGFAELTGENSRWENSDRLSIAGPSSNGELRITNGATLTSDEAQVGIGMLGTGKITLNGTGTTWTNGDQLSIGEYGHGEMIVENGAQVFGADSTIGRQSGSSGIVTIRGSNSSWTNSSSLTVAERGTSELLISEGAVVSNVDGTVGNHTNASGSVVVTGSNSQWNNSSSLIVGLLGDGHITVADGGVIASPDIGLFSRGTGRIQNGGTVEVGATLINTGLLEIDSGGLLSTTTIINAGTLKNEGEIAFATMTNNGTYMGDITIGSGIFVSGNGVFDGEVTVENGGTFSPGSSPGTGNTAITSWNAGGAYLWEINALEGSDGSQGSDPGWDLWNTGELTIEGLFTIELTTLALNNEPGALEEWDAFEAYQWKIATSENAAFLTLDDLLLDVSAFQNSTSGGSFWLSSSTAGDDLFLNFTPVPEPSSYCLLLLGLAACLAHRSLRK